MASKDSAAKVAEKAAKEGHKTGDRPNVTTVEGENPGDPQVNTAPGDAPFETTDPSERISTVIPSGAEVAEAAKAGLPVVAYVKLPEPERDDEDREDRTERYTVGGVEIEHNLETGESRRV
jgi:hypothetical protein